MSSKIELGDYVYVGTVTKFKVEPENYYYIGHRHGEAALSSMFPKSIIDLKSMKYLPVASLAADQVRSSKKKRDTADSYVKVFPPASSRQKPMVPNWSSMQYNRRPIINTPWMKDTQGIAMNSMNTINSAMLELSDIDIQRETARSNLALVQRMAELVQAEKEKVKSEMRRVQVDIERIIADKDKLIMDTQKLDMEREMMEAKMMAGTARST